MGYFRGIGARVLFVLATGLLAAVQAQAAFQQIDGFPGVMPGTTRQVIHHPVSNSTTTNGATFSETGGAAHITLGGNGNTAGALELVYSMGGVDLTDGGTNTQFYLVMNKILREHAEEWQTALSVTIDVVDVYGTQGTYNTGISSVAEGQAMVLNFDCAVNPVCFSPQPQFSAVQTVIVRLAFPNNYASSQDITELEVDSIYVTPTGAVFPPEFTSAGTSATWSEGAGGTINFWATGIPTPTLSQSGALPAGVSFNAATGTLSGTPAAGTMGTYTPVIKASNKVGSTARAFTLTVKGPPQITSASSTTFLEGRSNSFSVTANAVPAPTFAIASGALPAGVSLSSSGTLSGTPSNANASYSFTIKADNGESPADLQSFTLNIDRAPRVNAFTLNGTEDTTLAFTGTSFDVEELDGQSVEVRIVSLPSHGTLKLNAASVTAGQVIASADLGNLSFVPDADWNGSTTFSWQASDSELWSGSVDATLQIAATNDAPVIAEGSTSSPVIDEDNALVQQLNATDVDVDSLTWQVSADGGHGTASVTATGQVVYQPAQDFNGSDVFAVQVVDGHGGVTPHTFNVTVSPINDAPVITQGPSIPVTMDEDGSTLAFAVSLDATDIENDVLTWSLHSDATHGSATVSGSGASPTVSYAPAADFNGADSFVVRVTDDGGAHADITVDVTVQPVNDAPTISGTPANEAIENVAYSFTPTPDDVDAGETFSFFIDGKPAWATFDTTTGELYGTPATGDAGVYGDIAISVSDGDETASLGTFSITVLSDLDGDAIADRDDLDIDGDDIPNDFEIAHGLDPEDALDAGYDSDNDGVSNLDEYNAGSDLNADDNPPVVIAPADVEIPSTGLFTEVTLDAASASATDVHDGDVAVQAPEVTRLAPGLHTLTWQASDAAGNVGTATQQVKVLPQVSFGRDYISGEGRSVSAEIYLNGAAPEYPVEIPYTVSGTAGPADHDLVDGVITITSGKSGSLHFDLLVDGLAEGTEEVLITLGTPSNAVPGFRTIQRISVTEENVAPWALLVPTQPFPTRIVSTAGGLVDVHALYEDPNVGDSITVGWGRSPWMNLSTASDRFTFDPSGLTDGGVSYLSATVSDGELETSVAVPIRAVHSLPVLGDGDADGDGEQDQDEGFADADLDGIPAWLDAVEATNVLQGRKLDSTAYLLESEPGTMLMLGPIALALEAQAGVLSPEMVPASFPSDLHTDQEHATLLDIQVFDRSPAGSVISVVVPLRAALGARSAVMLHTGHDWKKLEPDAVNAVASAPGAEGFCPSPGAEAWEEGLGHGHWCVRLTLEEGGLYDVDDRANALLDIRGGVVSLKREEGFGWSEEDEGPFGIGSSGPVALLVMLALAARRTSRRLRLHRA